MRFEQLTSSAQWSEALPLLQELRPNTALAEIESRRVTLFAAGYELHGMYDDSGNLVTVAGIALHPHLIRGSDLWIHELVTRNSVRGRGYGLLMLRYLEKCAVVKGCSRLYLHTQLFREDAQRFYETRAKYNRYGIVYSIDL